MRRAGMFVAVFVVLVAVRAEVCPGKTIYVDGDAVGVEDGSGWGDAYRFLQDALADANASDKPVEILVAEGVYRPDRSAAEPSGTGDRFATFLLINGVSLKGGYAGFGQSDPNARDIAVYETILSGDLDGNDVDVNDLAELRDEASRGENAYHVVTSRDSNETAVLEGMTITGGNANEYWPDPPPYEESGGGMYNEGGGGIWIDRGRGPTVRYAATIRNCRFVSNSATWGGGMYNNRSYPKVVGCSFIGNSAPIRWTGHVGQGGKGGGMYNEQSRPMVTECVFIRNSAGHGGGVFNKEADAIVASCTFSANCALEGDGGGMGNSQSSPTVSKCVFRENSCLHGSGGGIANHLGRPRLLDCVFIGNSAASGAGVYNTQSTVTVGRSVFVGNSCRSRGGGVYGSRSDMSLTNCILVGNQAKRLGGGLSSSRSTGTVVNCTVVGNRADNPGGGIHWGHGSEGVLSDSILWDNDASGGVQLVVDGVHEAAKLTVEYSLVMGGEDGVHAAPSDSLDWGDGNIDVDPCFADAGHWDANGTPDDANDDYWVDGDYHLKSQGGRWGPGIGVWVVDGVMSPCIDAGDPMAPIMHEPFPNGGRLNMGAYGGTVEASKSYFGGTPCDVIIAGDVNGDCVVDFLDFGIMGLHWLEGVDAGGG